VYAMSTTENEQETSAKVIEALAEYAHTAWSGWMDYMFSKMTLEHSIMTSRDTGRLIMPEWAVERWQRQAATAYADLPENEKESDRDEARKMIAAIGLTKLAPHMDGIIRAMTKAYDENPRKEYYMTLTPEKLASMLHQNIAEMRLALEFDNDVEDKCADVANYAAFILRRYKIGQEG